ncbi:uncharacterized protein PSFLO_02647 [Pseudozyma flocculosa]|uniref:Uncharacterized protein n=1 Tax=Pseudozyma flocculosa TaxID=84751 RepID=A0A5C3EZF4_9BASI|nr:uncharacterized protein PSFLO_02647 [Pseudozyma flocculosa]
MEEQPIPFVSRQISSYPSDPPEPTGDPAPPQPRRRERDPARDRNLKPARPHPGYFKPSFIEDPWAALAPARPTATASRPTSTPTSASATISAVPAAAAAATSPPAPAPAPAPTAIPQPSASTSEGNTTSSSPSQ